MSSVATMPGGPQIKSRFHVERRKAWRTGQLTKSSSDRLRNNTGLFDPRWKEMIAADRCAIVSLRRGLIGLRFKAGGSLRLAPLKRT